MDTLMWDNENPDDKGKQWKDKKGKKEESKASEGKWLEAGSKEIAVLYDVKNSALMGDFEPFINLVKQGGGDWSYFEQNPNKEEILQQIDMELENLKMSQVDRGNWDALGMHQESKANETEDYWDYRDQGHPPDDWVNWYKCKTCGQSRMDDGTDSMNTVDQHRRDNPTHRIEWTNATEESYSSEAGAEDHGCAECGFTTSDNSEYLDHLNSHEV